MPKAKAKAETKSRNARRGTTPVPFRLRADTLADLDLIAAHLSRPDGLARSRADAVRVAVAKFAAEIRTAKSL